MTKTILFSVLLICSLCITVLGQAESPTPAPQQAKPLDPGRFDGTKYVNEGFGVSLSVPSDWVLITGPSREANNEELKKLIRSADKANEDRVRNSMDRSTTLLALTKLPRGQPNNAAFMLIAERIPSATIKTEMDVLRSIKTTMTGTNFNIEFQGEETVQNVGGGKFGVATIKNSSELGVFMQKIYITVKDGFALEFFFTYTDAADLAAFDGIVKTIHMK